MTWGQNSCGQLGTGPTPSGFLIDALTPVYVEPFAPPVHGPQGSAHHSRTAVEPEVGAGAADKGDTDEVATEDEDESVATASSAEPPKRRLIPSRGTLRMPRPRVRARQIAAGSYHSLVIDEEGKLWTWGARGHGCLGAFDAHFAIKVFVPLYLPPDNDGLFIFIHYKLSPLIFVFPTSFLPFALSRPR